MAAITPAAIPNTNNRVSIEFDEGEFDEGEFDEREFEGREFDGRERGGVLIGWGAAATGCGSNAGSNEAA